MKDNFKTRAYLKEMNAVEIERKIRFDNTKLPNYIGIFIRIYYKKRNNKICYVDINYKTFKIDKSKFKKYVYYNTFSTGDNDWRPLHTTSISWKYDKEYKEQLIKQYQNENNNL